jgi:hypothetical protein
MPLRPIGTKHVPLPEHPKPVEYQLKVVPVPVAGAETATPERTPTVTPDPEVFDPPVEETVPEPVVVIEESAPEEEVVPTIVEPEPVVAEITAEPEIEAEPVQIVEAEPEIEAEPVETTEPQPVEFVEAEPVEDIASKVLAVSEEAETVPEVETATAAEAMLAELNAKETVSESKSQTAVTAATDDEPDETSNALTLADPVVDAPSIGPKTASRLEKVDIYTIGDLLNADPEATAQALNVRYIKTDTLQDWQDQTRLMVDAPGLRVLDSQILVGAGIRSVEDLAEASATKVLKAATSFLDTPKGARVLWGGENNVDKTEVENWIGLAKSACG